MVVIFDQAAVRATAIVVAAVVIVVTVVAVTVFTATIAVVFLLTLQFRCSRCDAICTALLFFIKILLLQLLQ